MTAVKAERDRQRGGDDIAADGGPPHHGDMEARVAVLEQLARDTKDALAGLRSELAGVKADTHQTRIDIAEMRGRISQHPSTWQMVTTIIGGQVALAALLAGAVTLIIGFLGKS